VVDPPFPFDVLYKIAVRVWMMAANLDVDCLAGGSAI
jgi:hypothetical protein